MHEKRTYAEVVLLFQTVVCIILTLLSFGPIVMNVRKNRPSAIAQLENTPEWKGWKIGLAVAFLTFSGSLYPVLNGVFYDQYNKNRGLDASISIVLAQAAAITLMCIMFLLTTLVCLFSNLGSELGRNYPLLCAWLNKQHSCPILWTWRKTVRANSAPQIEVGEITVTIEETEAAHPASPETAEEAAGASQFSLSTNT